MSLHKTSNYSPHHTRIVTVALKQSSGRSKIGHISPKVSYVLYNSKIYNSVIKDIILRLHYMSHKQIIFCWLPSHVGIRGNDKADKVAKSALSLQPSNLKLPYTDFKPAINKYLLNKWQLIWNTDVDNKLHSIKSILGEWRPAFRTDRKEVVPARLRIGHSFITHSYLLTGEEQPTCVPCDTPFTIKHILLNCVDFQNSYDKYYKVNTLKELFETIEIHKTFSYLKEIGLFNKI